MGRLELVQDFPHLLEAADALTQLGPFRQGRVGPATASKQAIDFFHERTQGSQPWQAPCDAKQGPAFPRCRSMLDEQVTMFKKIRDFLLQSLALADRTLGCQRRRPTSLPDGLSCDQLFPNRGHGAQNCLGQFLEDVEFATLRRPRTAHRLQRFWIKGRTSGGNALQGQLAAPQRHLEAA